LIQSYSEVLKEEFQDSADKNQQLLLEKIFNSSNFMKSLLDNLLDITKIESGKYDLNKKMENLNSLVENQVEFHQLIARKKNIEVQLSLGTIPPVNCNKNAIIQIIANLVGNAIKFSPPNTLIQISTEKKDKAVRFSVKDEGPGISPEEQKLLFGEFQTLSSKPTGGEKSTGLGLAIVKKLVTLHEGKVGVISESGKGSTFFFTLPLKE